VCVSPPMKPGTITDVQFARGEWPPLSASAAGTVAAVTANATATSQRSRLETDGDTTR
jgi:hypothetical protein